MAWGRAPGPISGYRASSRRGQGDGTPWIAFLLLSLATVALALALGLSFVYSAGLLAGQRQLQAEIALLQSQNGGDIQKMWADGLLDAGFSQQVCSAMCSGAKKRPQGAWETAKGILGLAGGEGAVAGSCANDDGGEGKGGGSSGEDEDEDKDKDEEYNGPLRVAAAVAFFLAVGIPVWIARRLDTLPPSLNFVDRALGGSGGGVASPLSKRIAYRIDTWFSTNPYSKTMALLYLTLALVAFGGLALYAVSTEPLDTAVWESLAGVGIDWTFASDAENETISGWSTRVVAVVTSVGGMLVTALMLGIVSEAIGEKVDDLKKGRSDVLESGHTLILGWNEKLFPLIKQICLANESEGGGAVVVMTDKDKEEMEEEIDSHDFDCLGSRIICRTGNPLLLSDLKKVAVSQARSIIVLGEDEGPDEADAKCLRVVLSLAAARDKHGGLSGHITAEMADVDNEPLVRMVGGGDVQTVVAHDVIGRLMIQSARQPGLAQIWEMLLGFDGCEFYMKEWPELEGASFGEAVYRFPEAIVCGVKSKRKGTTLLNPPDSYVIAAGDQLLVVAEDDDSYDLEGLPALRPPSGGEARFESIPASEKVLFCGWRRDMDDLIQVLDDFVSPGSELWIFSDVELDERDERLRMGGMDPHNLSNLTLEHRVGDAVNRKHLEMLPLERFDSVLILANTKEGSDASITDIDSRSLATLLLIRDIQAKRHPLSPGVLLSEPRDLYPVSKGGEDAEASSCEESDINIKWVQEMAHVLDRTVVISEILDPRTRNLIADTGISDYVLSNEIVSMALAMVSEDAEVNKILAELFTDVGNELYIRPVERYLPLGEGERCTYSFWEVMQECRGKGDVVMGYKQLAMEAPVLNPANKGEVLTWRRGDVLVIMAEDE